MLELLTNPHGLSPVVGNLPHQRLGFLLQGFSLRLKKLSPLTVAAV